MIVAAFALSCVSLVVAVVSAVVAVLAYRRSAARIMVSTMKGVKFGTDRSPGREQSVLTLTVTVHNTGITTTQIKGTYWKVVGMRWSSCFGPPPESPDGLPHGLGPCVEQVLNGLSSIVWIYPSRTVCQELGVTQHRAVTAKPGVLLPGNRAVYGNRVRLTSRDLDELS